MDHHNNYANILFMNTYVNLQSRLLAQPKFWLITGAAGFIGSHLLETLLRTDQNVIGFDNFSSGKQSNLDAIRNSVTSKQWSHFRFINGDVRNLDDCRRAMIFTGAGNESVKVEYVLHQAALCSVAKSIEDPSLANAININGFLNILIAACEAGVRRVVYASSSAVYGDTPGLPKQENQNTQPLSPYAVTKYVNELYADIFTKIYNLEAIGLRYFNVFGMRQDPAGAYAAVIPKWIEAMINHNPIVIYGDGETSRDFCHVNNVVQANLLAACSDPRLCENIYNVGTRQSTTLNQLYDYIRQSIIDDFPQIPERPQYSDFRPGDIRHSLADITKACDQLGYKPDGQLSLQIKETVKWHLKAVENTLAPSLLDHSLS